MATFIKFKEDQTGPHGTPRTVFVNVDFIAWAALDKQGALEVHVSTPGMNNGYRNYKVHGDDVPSALEAIEPRGE